MRVLQLTCLLVILSSTACNQNRTPDPSVTSSVDIKTTHSTPGNSTSQSASEPDIERPAPVVCGRIVEWNYLEDGVPKAVLMIQKDALIIDESGCYVSKLFDRGDKRFVVEIPVKAGGAIAGEWVQIVPLLGDGDQVVIRANERLKSGREVEIIKVVGGHPSYSNTQ